MPLIEEGWTEDPVTIEVLRRYLEPLKEGPDTIIMGCTHYPLITKLMEQTLPNVTFINSAVATSKFCKSELALRSLLRKEHTSPQYHFLVTDNLEKFRKISYYFLGQEPQSLELVDLTEEDAERFKL